MHIMMLAAENGALPGGKVGGIGDVLRDIPGALQAAGHRVSVVMPAYGRFAASTGARRAASIRVAFAGAQEEVQLFRLARTGEPELLLLDHPLFAACGAGKIYCDDPPDRPFATDAGKFALFCRAVAEGLASVALPVPDVLHLHDWHAATTAVLLRRLPRYRKLKALPLVFTIHNLALQGIRPLAGDDSSLCSWFPELAVDSDLMDPRYAGCYNPVRAAIRLCDRVHAVSPTYAREICDPDGSFGEGLAPDLAEARDAGRLHGILNGCDYDGVRPPVLSFAELLVLARDELKKWTAGEPLVRSAYLLALRRVDEWLDSDYTPARQLTLVGRFTEQKIGLLTQPQADGRSTLSHALDLLQEDEVLLALGNGQREMEALFTQAQAECERLLFLCGYSERLSEQFYGGGDLFLMPSRFEPCGIAQMLAMRSGQPCLVNRTGGLADTVEDGVTGFVFDANSDAERAGALLKRLRQALTQLRRHGRKRGAMREAAAAARFPWDVIAQRYTEQLYDISA